jgi:NAD(P)H-dependent FMN reductase
MPDVKVLALVGSLRAASVNRQLAELSNSVVSSRSTPTRSRWC